MANSKTGCTTIAYPESLPADWETQLNLMGVGYAWALHDQDVNSDGTQKKAHIHIIFQLPLSAKQKKYVSSVTTVKMIQDIRSNSALYEYLTHENDSDKHHYDKSIIQHSPDWCQELFEQSTASRSTNEIAAEIEDLILDNNITEWCDLVRAVRVLGVDSASYVRKHAFYFRCIIDSNRYSQKRGCNNE